MPQPYDRAFKVLAEEHPRGLLYLFARLPLDVPAEVELVGRDLTLPAFAADQLYRVEIEGRVRLHHLEFQTRYETEMPDRMLSYAMAAALKYGLPLESPWCC
ncbi:MAG: hypothetical protein KIT09_07850 [Bryobacteraceae bacterium]|nr:hypothetical protein [Bryobacteraceae bacterium]